MGCWAHARRPFYQIMQITSKKGLAHYALHQIQNLYAIEAKIAHETIAHI